MKNIAVIGIGGIGGYFGGKLTQLLGRDSQVNIYFIARGRQLEAIQSGGLVLDAEEGRMTCVPTKAMERIADLPQLDYCLICIKGYDLAEVLRLLKDKISDSTVILPLLNGVDIFERVRSVVKNGYLHPACVYISTFVEKPGIVIQRGPSSTILLGPDPGRSPEDRSILALLEAAGIKHGWKEEPFVEIWNKYLFIAPFGLVTANTGKTIGEALRSEADLSAVKSIMGEIVALARAKGIGLSTGVVEETLAKAAKFPAETRTSFQRDVSVAEKPDERDLFAGSIIRMGKDFAVPTPVTEAVFASIERKKPGR